MSARARRFIPRLETLDDRSLPSVVNQVGTTVIVNFTGDQTANDANTVIIEDNGQLVDGVTIVVDGQPFGGFGEVSAIVIQTLGGDDIVEYNLTGPLTTTRLISADLGRGADSFTVNMNSWSVSGDSTNLGITASGDGGGDTLTLNANGATVSPEAGMSVQFFGKAGKDSIAFNFDPGFLDLGNVMLSKDQKH